MDLKGRQDHFQKRIQTMLGFDKTTWKISKLFGVSNSAKVLEGGIQLGVSNLDSWGPGVEGAVFSCLLRFPPGDEVYFAVYVHQDMPGLNQRLENMKTLGHQAKLNASNQDDHTDPGEDDGAGHGIQYSARNNVVVVCLADDGKIYLRNKGFWDSMQFDRTAVGPAASVKRIVCAAYPPNASAHRSLLAREFIGYLTRLVGRDRLEELYDVWPGESEVSPLMKRQPATIPLEEIHQGIELLGGHYSGDLVARLHVALNHLARKHFVILTGISGTGKTGIVERYARVVHGVTDMAQDDPFYFRCSVRPNWTDPSDLTGYFDVITDKYVVPEFLQAVLTAHAHPDSPVFACIDEMNLARVEYYLADVLSAMETETPKLHLHGHSVPLEGSRGGLIADSVPLPSNLYIIGTINVDETTLAISDKVLDRATLIDMSKVDLGGFETMFKAREPALSSSVEACIPLLKEIHKVLETHRLAFGYRVCAEFIRYYHFAVTVAKQGKVDVIDHQIAQKILVKLRGSERQAPMLAELAGLLTAYPTSLAIVKELQQDLADYGTFAYSR